MISSAHTRRGRGRGLLPRLLHPVGARSPAGRPRRSAADVDAALVRALCHDMQGSLAFLHAALGRLEHRDGSAELLDLAKAQVVHLASLLRTAQASGAAGAGSRCPGSVLPDVVRASVAVSGLPDGQVTLRLDAAAGEVRVGDSRLQRILVNLLENAHRHGRGAPVELSARCRPGWVALAVRQPGVPAERVSGYLHTRRPPTDLTGLGLWSVRRQTDELGGRLTCQDDGGGLTLTVHLPDR